LPVSAEEILLERIPAKITATTATAAVKYNSQPIINSLNQINYSKPQLKLVLMKIHYNQ